MRRPTAGSRPSDLRSCGIRLCCAASPSQWNWHSRILKKRRVRSTDLSRVTSTFSSAIIIPQLEGGHDDLMAFFCHQ